MKLTKSQLKEMIREEMKSLNETVPMGKMDRTKFMKFFDLAVKHAGTDAGAIQVILKRMGVEGKFRRYGADMIAQLVKKMTGGGE